MENVTDEQLLELAAKYFPQIPQETVISTINEIKANVPEITNQQLMFAIAKHIRDNNGAGGDSRFGDLLGKLRK